MASLVAELEKYGINLTKKHLFIAGAPFVGFFLFLFIIFPDRSMYESFFS